ncbi:MAG: thioredoxin [Bacteroidota bacterium]
MESTPKKQTFSELIQGDTPVLVDFFATWCGPCQAMTPVINQLKEEVGDQAHIIKVDVDKNPQASMAYGIQGVPTFMVFKQGEVVWRQSGMQSGSALKQIILENQ